MLEDKFICNLDPKFCTKNSLNDVISFLVQEGDI